MLQCARYHHQAFTLVRYFPPLEKFHCVPHSWLQESRKTERGRGAAGAHHKTACCSCAGNRVKGHRALDLLGQQVVEEGGATP